MDLTDWALVFARLLGLVRSTDLGDQSDYALAGPAK